MRTIKIEEGKFEEGQLLEVLNVNNLYRINRVTEKAICIETSDGKWGGDGFKPLWLPLSQLSLCGVNDNPERSQFGIHTVQIPEWLVFANSKKW